jgi:hypothetical protein
LVRHLAHKIKERISIFEERACKHWAVSGGLMSRYVGTGPGKPAGHGPAT